MRTFLTRPAWTLAALMGCAAGAWAVVWQTVPRPGEQVLREVDVLAVVALSIAAALAGMAAWRVCQDLRSERVTYRLLIGCLMALVATTVTFLLVAVPVILYASSAADLAHAWTIPFMFFFVFATGVVRALIPAIPFGLVAGVAFWVVAERFGWLRGIGR